MGLERRRSVRWGALAAALTVVLSVAGIALGTPSPPPGGEMGADPEIEAAGAIADPIPPRPSTTAAAVTTTRPRPSSLDANGISMRLRMEPAEPHVGDTVTFTFETWATVPTDFCCINHFYVNEELIYTRFHGQGPCPLAPSERWQQVSHVVTAQGPVGVQLQANRVDLCTGPPTFTTNNLHATVTVLP